MIRDARQAGMKEASIEALKADLGEQGGLWPEHVAIVQAFDAGGTQWRTTLMPDGLGFRTIWIGLDYPALKVALEAQQIEITPEIWRGIMTMEQAAMAAMNGVTEQL